MLCVHNDEMGICMTQAVAIPLRWFLLGSRIRQDCSMEEKLTLEVDRHSPALAFQPDGLSFEDLVPKVRVEVGPRGGDPGLVAGGVVRLILVVPNRDERCRRSMSMSSILSQRVRDSVRIDVGVRKV